MKRLICAGLTALMLIGAFAGCSNEESTTTPAPTAAATATPGAQTDPGTEPTPGSETTPDAAENTMSGPITVLSREDGSGTRSAFIELLGIEQEDADGNTVDMTTVEAEITNSTSVMLTTVAGNTNAIGYVSLGVLDDTVKALAIDGVEATAENVSNGSYAISRPFNIATNGTPSEVAQDFINYILSADGQAVVEAEGYIAVENTGAFTSTQPSGSIVVAGSSSVTPVMEKLIEAYNAINPNADIELQQSDSSTGMNSAIEGACDIGMASRELKDSEIEAGLTPICIATDGIAVIVNQANTINGLTSDQVRSIYVGDITDWGNL